MSNRSGNVTWFVWEWVDMRTSSQSTLNLMPCHSERSKESGEGHRVGTPPQIPRRPLAADSSNDIYHSCVDRVLGRLKL